jgi:hypothetical protein
MVGWEPMDRAHLTRRFEPRLEVAAVSPSEGRSTLQGRNAERNDGRSTAGRENQTLKESRRVDEFERSDRTRSPER